jgi:hypothetical protein
MSPEGNFAPVRKLQKKWHILTASPTSFPTAPKLVLYSSPSIFLEPSSLTNNTRMRTNRSFK